MATALLDPSSGPLSFHSMCRGQRPLATALRSTQWSLLIGLLLRNLEAHFLDGRYQTLLNLAPIWYQFTHQG